MQHQNGFLQLVEELKPMVKEIDIHQTKDIVDNAKAKVIDVREDHEWESGCIPNAVHLSKGVIERDIETTIADKATPIVLYCSGGFRSLIAAYNLNKMGYTNVYSMSGGLKNWIAAGYPIASVEH